MSAEGVLVVIGVFLVVVLLAVLVIVVLRRPQVRPEAFVPAAPAAAVAPAVAPAVAAAVDTQRRLDEVRELRARMKDFIDLWVLLHDTTLDDAELRRAVEATFARRQTAVPSNQPIGLSDVFADNATKQLQWRAFLTRNKLEPLDLGDVVRTIRERAMQFGFTGT